MKQEDLLDAIGQVKDTYVMDADVTPSRRRAMLPWLGGLVACLCIATVGGVFFRGGFQSDGGSSTPESAGQEESGRVDAQLSEDTDSTITTNGQIETGTDAGDGYCVTLAAAVYEEYPVIPQVEDYLSSEDADTESATNAYFDAYDDYNAAISQLKSVPLTSAQLDGVHGFSDQTVNAILTGSGDENRVYSPINLYFALSMMAEATAGDTQQALLDVLGADGDTLAADASALWTQLYTDNGASKLLLANSLWTNLDTTLSQDTLETLAADFKASSYAVPMGTQSADDAIADWLNAQTGGLLTDQSAAIQTAPETLLELFSTLYFYDPWIDTFQADQTAPGTFTCADGSTLTCDFMHRNTTAPYYTHTQYTVAALNTQNAVMTFILPQEGVSIDQLLETTSIQDILEAYTDSTQYGEVRYAVPKFDVTSSLTLNDLLDQLGLAALLDGSGDFSPLSQEDGLFLSQVSQSARVAVDEDGVSAAAFTRLPTAGAAEPSGRCDLILDRPFLFVISKPVSDGDHSRLENIILYSGVVNCPTE